MNNGFLFKYACSKPLPKLEQTAIYRYQAGGQIFVLYEGGPVFGYTINRSINRERKDSRLEIVKTYL